MLVLLLLASSNHHPFFSVLLVFSNVFLRSRRRVQTQRKRNERETRERLFEAVFLLLLESLLSSAFNQNLRDYAKHFLVV